MNNKQLQYAIELSKSLNFSQTAKKLRISQPALSKQIINLEKELGVELFERKKNSLSVSLAGEYFFREAQDLLYREEQMIKSLEKFKSDKYGTLTIGISPFRSLYLLPKVIKKVKEAYPGVKVVLHEITSDSLRSDAAEGKFDFAIVNLPVNEAVLDVCTIEQDTLVLAVPKSMINKISCNLSGDIPQIDFKDCKNLSFIVVSKQQEMRQLFERICLVADICPNIAMEVVGLSTAWEMARAGIGATLLPLQFIKSMNADDNITLLAPKCDTNTRQPAIITRRGQYLPEYAKYAIKLLKEGNTI